MTIKQAYENCLVELNKVQAPSLLLTDFVYLFNKAIQKYINKRYNIFETSQQVTDDLRVLLNTKKISGIDLEKITPTSTSGQNIFGTNYLVTLPTDYVHMLNCICEFQMQNPKCEECNLLQVGANKLDTNEWPHVIDNYYMRPSVKRPYYYISNIADQPEEISSLDIERVSKSRYGNTKVPTMQIKCGGDIREYELKAVYIDYLRAPEYVNLTRDQLDEVDDSTAFLEFPDYVIFEIINELVTMILENGKDQRLQTFIGVSPSVQPMMNSTQKR